MFIKDIANILYVPNTSSENLPIIVKLHCGDERILWKGPAKDLKHQKDLFDWMVVEMRVNRTTNPMVPDYNKGKIITVC